MGYTLQPAVVKEAQRVFGAQDIDYVLTKLADTPLTWERNAPPPRVHLAVIWLSNGERKRFDYHIDGAQFDWRDTLIQAGLAGDDWREVIKKRGIDSTDW